MRNISQVVPVAANAIANQGFEPHIAPRPRSVDRASAEVINEVFVDLQASFPAWRQVWPDKESLNASKRIWITAFVEAGISSMSQIQRGLRCCRHHGSAWPPPVGLFLKWCKEAKATPESLGFPSVDRAYALAAEFSHPAADRSKCLQIIYHAANETGFHFLSSERADKTFPVFSKKYLEAVDIVVRGGELINLPIPEERMLTKISDPKIGLAALAGLKRQVRGVTL